MLAEIFMLRLEAMRAWDTLMIPIQVRSSTQFVPIQPAATPPQDGKDRPAKH